LQAEARQALLDQCLGQDQQAAFGLDQRVVERRVQVQRLVGGQRPRRGGPDHREGRLRQAGQAESGGQFLGFGREEGHVDRRRTLVGVLDLELGQ
jgi:hypothetical protein